MVADGRSVVFISHKLGEVLAIADRITVMRNGRVTAAGRSPVGATRSDLARLMVGRSVLEIPDKTEMEPGEVVLDVRDVEARNDRGLVALRGASIQVRAGEIVGIAAVAGNGQGELAEVITGLRPGTGEIRIDGKPLAARTPREGIQRGVGHVPEDRAGTGSAPNLSIVENLILKRYREAPVGRGWVVDHGAAREVATELKDRYRIAAPSIDTRVRLLSGGNLQRLILAREIDAQPRVLIAVQPTRGLDVGAIETVHRMLLERRASGAAILLISEELDEILALADRVDVMFEGRIVGSFPAAEAEVETIGLLMTGGHGPGSGAASSPEAAPA
jgi:simple sugar transport system ATP-binding protein